MAAMVPLIAQVPISAPTPSSMKIATRPLDTPSTAPLRMLAHGVPFLTEIRAASTAAKVSAIWLGPWEASAP